MSIPLVQAAVTVCSFFGGAESYFRFVQSLSQHRPGYLYTVPLKPPNYPCRYAQIRGSLSRTSIIEF